MKSGDQLRRMLRLVPYLQRNPGVSVAEAARHFSLSEKQLLADLSILQFCGLPAGYVDDLFDVDLEATREDGLIFFHNAEVLARPLRMTAAEATSLMLALESLVELSGGLPAASSALSKLREALGSAREDIHIEISGGSTEHQRELLGAIEDQHVVRLDYTGLDTRSQPHVEPMQLRVVDGYTYLDAWSRDREDWRSFRLDRVRQVTVLDDTFEPRAGADQANRDWFAEATASVDLTVDHGGAWIAEYHPYTELSRQAEELTITLPLGSRQWLVGLVMRLGDSVLDVSDPDLAVEAGRSAGLALQRYGAVLGDRDDAR